ncbi:MAG: hypothetical protein WD823_10895 [Sulfuricaulis sp.]|uniref:hypothetical protein n=1 Tax=Sulfuricaulis sp. TaxID=2003553 RepID=UPI0034A47732
MSSEKDVEANHASLSRRRRMELLRHHGFSGGVITKHRALLTLPLKPAEGWMAMFLAVLLLAGWLMLLRWVNAAWTWGTSYWSDVLFEGAAVKHKGYSIGPLLRIEVPYLDITAGVPDSGAWWMALLLTTLTVLISFIIPRRQMPVIYLLRALAFIQTCSLAYFAINPAYFPYTVSDYQSGMLMAGLFVISLVPVLLGATYYIFDFGLPKKLLLTVITMFYLGILIPMQYLVHVYLIQQYSMLFMPVLFFFFGLPLDIFVFIAFYAWGMSWRNKRAKSVFR